MSETSAALKLDGKRSRQILTRETVSFLKSELDPLNKEFQKTTMRLTQMNEEHKQRNKTRRIMKDHLVQLKAKIAFIESHLSRQ